MAPANGGQRPTPARKQISPSAGLTKGNEYKSHQYCRTFAANFRLNYGAVRYGGSSTETNTLTCPVT